MFQTMKRKTKQLSEKQTAAPATPTADLAKQLVATPDTPTADLAKQRKAKGLSKKQTAKLATPTEDLAKQLLATPTTQTAAPATKTADFAKMLVAPFATKEAKVDHKTEQELATFNVEFEKVRVCFGEAEKKAKEGLLKTATLRQAEGLLTLTELRSHFDLAALDAKTAVKVDEWLQDAIANFNELRAKAGKLSAKIWEQVKEKDLSNAWSYKELPQLHEIFTLTDEIFYRHNLKEKSEPKNQSSKRQDAEELQQGSSAESLSDLEISIDDGDIPLTKKQVLDAFDSLADSPDDVEAHGIIERFENQEYPPRWNSPEVTAILSLPEHEESAQYLRPLDRDINFHQIYGYLPQKASIMHNIVMRNISIHRGYKRAKGANPRLPHKGVLLHGPSGTGKTQMVRAAATLLKDIVVYFELTKSDLLTKWLGESEKNLTNLFKLAEAVGPSIIFIDEGEELFGKKSKATNEASKNMASKLLSLMTDESRVLVACATNSPWDMEESFRRRFTLTMHIGMPNEGDRALILKHLLRKYFCLITDAQYQRLGEQAKDLTGGDLEVIVYDVYNRKENHRIEAGFMQQCPIRSTLRDPVYVPCGPYAKRRIAVRPLSIAMLADHVEIGPITYRNVLNAITRHTKTVPERLVDDHIAYSKNKDYKPAEETKTVKHVIENNPK